MEVITGREAMARVSQCYRSEGRTIGFVPTMGALHQGHLSLIGRSKSENDITVVSIFVNPSQFNSRDDFRLYPRMPEKDLEMLREAGVSVVFLPAVEEVYVSGESRSEPAGPFSTTLEGSFRPGHFEGVAAVVTRLFSIVQPHRAYFGLKDFQQVKVVQDLVNRKKIPVEIIPCETLREPDGLAMSSRNLRLTPEERSQASAIYRSLLLARDLRKELQPSEVRAEALKFLEEFPLLRPEYFELLDANSLEPVTRFENGRKVVACAAVFAGNIRLIDNLYL